MTAPLPRRKGDHFVQLGTWVHAAAKDQLIRAVKVERRQQRAIVEEALADYFLKRPLPAKPAPA